MVAMCCQWKPEEDYTNYPDANKCDCDRIAELIMESGYEIRTDLENLVYNILAYFDCCDNLDEYDMENNFVSECMRYVQESGGFEEFDYYV